MLCATSIFAQQTAEIKGYLSYENDVVIKKENLYWLVELQSFKVVANKITIKGRTICSFELENLLPTKIKIKRNLINETFNTSQIWVRNNGGLDNRNNRIWVALNLGNITGCYGYEERDVQFDYPMLTD